MALYELSEREHATVMAALRAYQPDEHNEIASNLNTLEPLTAPEIDELCESINHKGENPLALHDAVQKLSDEYGYNGEHPGYPVDNWKMDVDNDDTRRGYWEWVYAEAESNGDVEDGFL